MKGEGKTGLTREGNTGLTYKADGRSVKSVISTARDRGGAESVGGGEERDVRAAV